MKEKDETICWGCENPQERCRCNEPLETPEEEFRRLVREEKDLDRIQ